MRKNAYLDTIWEEIIKFIRDALEARGCVREIKTVEISIQEFMEYFKSIGLESWVYKVRPTLSDMRRAGRLLWYYDHDKKKAVILDSSEASEKF